MKKLEQKLGIDKLTVNDVADVFFEIGNNGDIIMIKNDGVRKNNKYSVIIISSRNHGKSWRNDSDSISDSLKNVLKSYLEDSNSTSF